MIMQINLTNSEELYINIYIYLLYSDYIILTDYINLIMYL